MKANPNAPVFATYEIEINAPPDAVWKVLTDFGGWPSWNSNVQKVYEVESVTKGTVFKWLSGGTKIRSTVQEIDPPKLIVWIERVMGIRSIHIWSLTSRNGRTLVRAEESYAGPVAWFFRRSLQGMLEVSLSDTSKGLKVETEKRSAKG
jgi:uncharacterized protein YndB with AHSA1/START domain